MKEASNDLTSAERDAMMGFVVTSFEPTEPFPGVGYPDAVYEALTRRFGYLATEHGAVTWHASQVDADGFGRAGNVFSHVILDRQPALAPPRHHPISLWRSTEILSPHQYVSIAGSTIQRSEPEPSALLAVTAVVEFLFDGAQWRIGRLARLAGAIASALTGGPRVVVRVDDQEEAARWLAGVSLLFPLAVARRLAFSLYERAESSVGRSVRDAFESGVHVAVVPRDDDVTASDDLVVVDLADETVAGTPGDVPTLVEAVFFSAEDCSVVFEVIDMVAQRSGDADVSDPAWALAMSVLLLGDQYPDALDLARSVVVRSSPPQVAQDDLLRTTVESAAASVLGGDAQTLAQRLLETPTTSFAHRLIAGRYFFAAIDDREWLCGAERPPVVDMGDPSALGAAAEAACRALESAMEDGGTTSPDGSVWRLRLVDFIVRCGVVAPNQNGLVEAVQRALADELVQLSRNIGDGIDVLQACGPLSTRLRAEHLVPVLRSRRHLSAASVFATPPALLEWLDVVSLVEPLETVHDDLGQDLAALRLMRGEESRVERLDLARGWLAHWGGWRRMPEDGVSLLEACLPSWDLRDLLAVFDGRRIDLPDADLIPVILRSRDQDDLTQLEILRDAAEDSGVGRAIVSARTLCAVESSDARTWEHFGGFPRRDEEAAFIERLAELSRADEAARRRVAAAVWVLLLSIVSSRPPLSFLRSERFAARILPWIELAAASGVPLDATATYMAVRAGHVGGKRATAEVAALAAATARGATTRESLLDLLVETRESGRGRGRLIDAIAERMLAETDPDLEAPVLRVMEWASVSEGEAEKLWRQWRRNRGTLSTMPGRDAGDFLGGLFRNRSRGDL